MRTSTLRTLAAFAALCAAAPAARAGDNACWERDKTFMDVFANPPEGGDNLFFTAVAQKGNVSLLFPTTKTMMYFPLSLYELRQSGAGCSNTTLNGLQYFMPLDLSSQLSMNGSANPGSFQGTYNIAKNYPDPEPYYVPKISGAGASGSGITRTSAYQFGDWPNNGSGGNAQTIATACANANSNPGRQTQCAACLASNGYWLNPDVSANDTSTSAGVFMGNWLFFYPPKFLLLKLAYKMLVNGPLLAPLRQANITQNGATGGYLNQKYLPSCNGQGRPMNQITNALESLRFNQTANPVAEMLMNAGYYNSDGSGSTASFPTYFGSNSANWTDNSLPCAGCNQNFAVLITDGRGDTANASCVRDSSNNLPAYCSADAQCSTLGMGAEGDGDNYVAPTMTSIITGASVRKTPTGTCDMDFADDVAGWMANNDMVKSKPGTNVLTYVIGIGSNRQNELTSAIETAKAGKGSFANATDFSSLGQALVTIFQQIVTRATSFSVAAITTVQTRGTTFAFVPRFKPQQGNQWKGSLFRFKLYNEFAAGCTSSNYGTKSALNPNGNSSCSDVFLKDADGDFIGEDSNGDFVKLDNTAAYQPPPSINPWPIKSPTTPANPVWEAASLLATRVRAVTAGTSTDARTIYTATASSAGGPYNALTSFSVANLSVIQPMLKLGGKDSAFCQEMESRTRHVYTTEADCATDVVNYMLGQDLLLENTLNQVKPAPNPLYPRPVVLGDIFHSSPILVTPPTPQYLCDLGVATQCVYSLYSSTLTPLGPTAYPTYQTNNQYRTQTLLVGSNDGMLHAFNAGNDKTGDDPETSTVESSTSHYFDLGTGREMWAFIPPDLMPKLQFYILGQRHELFVDGTPMVRDIWVDGSGSTGADHKKQADEFHTVAIIGEREGGSRFFALDVTDGTAPRFLWSWPLAGTTTDLEKGQSWNDHSPAPPPIGPIAIADSQGAFSVGGTKAAEKYVVAVGGGYDNNLQRGRGIFLLDAWTGGEVFRFARMDSSGSDTKANIFPVAATPTLLDTNGDGLFDALTVGDVNGSVWTIDMMAPGQDTDGDGLVDNWQGARVFTQFKSASLAGRSPFFQLAAAVQQPTGDVRILLGSGDRSQIRGTGANCGLADLRSCIREGCTVDVQSKKWRIGSGRYDEGRWTWSPGGTAYTNQSISLDGSGPTDNSGVACTDPVSVDIEYQVSCGSSSFNYSNTVSCDWGAASAGTLCSDTGGKPLYTSADDTYTLPTMTPARFYSLRLFDSSGNRARFGTSASAANTYDGAALTDSSLINADSSTATSADPGWYVQYVNNEKTASGTLILSGCAVWNSLLPNTSQAVTCGAIPTDTAYLYHGDPVTGATNCGNGLPASLTSVRKTSRNAIVPPPMPTPVVAVNPNTGQISYSGVSLEPGGQPLQISVGQNDLFGTIHWLEVPRQTHDCRHNGTNCPQAAQ